MIQSDTPVPRGDLDGTAARAAARLDHDVGAEHGAGAERIDGAHGMHNSAAKPDAVFGRSAGQRIGANDGVAVAVADHERSEEHTSELQSLMRISYAVFCLKKKTT